MVSLSGAAGIRQEDGHTTVANYLWDINTFTWVKATGGTAGGTTVSVDNFPASFAVTGPLTDAELRAAALNTQSQPYSKRIDEVSPNLAYFGFAAVGSAEGSSFWQIQRMTLSSTITSFMWADGNASFDNSWTARGSSSYS